MDYSTPKFLIDHDQYTARRFEPTQEYHDYIQLIKTPIPDEVVESWKKMIELKLMNFQ